MKKRRFFLFFLSFSLVFTFSLRVEARSNIHDILAKGSIWSLNVDGAIGTLELLGGRGGKTADGGWEMTMEIKWQGNPGTLKAAADGKNHEQRVLLNVQRKNGLKVTCEGYIALESGRFMAGVTRHPASAADIHGAWYATKKKKEKEYLDSGRGIVEAKPVGRTSAQPQTRSSITKRVTGKCSISGKIHGPGLQAARSFFICLYGPENLTVLRDTKRFDREGGYNFTELPEGKYKLVVDSRADSAIVPHPSNRVVRCSEGAVQNIDFELK
ncbi:MAG: hypothetical protein KAT34_15460 [Candidatus Aminicenantes bacterium]|nr:hypothetical protein [Candidatus Aminicenantes bacterium]